MRGVRKGYSSLSNKRHVKICRPSVRAQNEDLGYSSMMMLVRLITALVFLAIAPLAPPAYIAQASPNDFYMRRIGSLSRGRATAHDVESLFGRGHSRASRPDGFIWYYALPVYNPFEEQGGGRR